MRIDQVVCGEDDDAGPSGCHDLVEGGTVRHLLDGG